MRLCFIIEAIYQNETMPVAVAQLLQRWGHTISYLEPHDTITCISTLTKEPFDAYVLKTVSDGPGLSLLEAAEAAGTPTINASRAIRMVRDKAVATAYASAQGLPTPLTYFLAHRDLLTRLPAEAYPLVVKPTNGSSCRGIYHLKTPADVATLKLPEGDNSFLLAQHYIENQGFDIKIYVIGAAVYAVAKRSPLHPDIKITKHFIPLSAELRALALRVGRLFGLDIYGLDVIESAEGPVIVDINDFPSFGNIPQAVPLVAMQILRLATQAQERRRASHELPILSMPTEAVSKQAFLYASPPTISPQG